MDLHSFFLVGSSVTHIMIWYLNFTFIFRSAKIRTVTQLSYTERKHLCHQLLLFAWCIHDSRIDRPLQQNHQLQTIGSRVTLVFSFYAGLHLILLVSFWPAITLCTLIIERATETISTKTWHISNKNVALRFCREHRMHFYGTCNCKNVWEFKSQKFFTSSVILTYHQLIGFRGFVFRAQM